VDFHYEVSRSLAACEGALLVVDASQGVEAQTLANVYMATEHNLAIVPVINKIDLPSADPENAIRQIEEVIGIDASGPSWPRPKTAGASRRSWRPWWRVSRRPSAMHKAPQGALARQLVRQLPRRRAAGARGRRNPARETEDSLARRRARLRDRRAGSLRALSQGSGRLGPGEVGFITAAIKEVADARVGDTITEASKPCVTPLPGFQPAKPMVFAGIFPTDPARYEDLRDALDKLRLNDASFSREPEVSAALGFGFRCGFLGLLHMEIVQERLEREYDLDLITTAPTVRFQVVRRDGSVVELDNPAKFPSEGDIERIEEPIIAATMHTPPEFVGGLIKLCEERRGTQTGLSYAGERRVIIRYDLPLTEVVFGFYDRMKSISRGYASLDYEPKGYRPRISFAWTCW
jgi:GTP-binding protein LepA